MANLILDGYLNEIRATQIYMRPFGSNQFQLVTATVIGGTQPQPNGNPVALTHALIAVYDDNSTVLHGKTVIAPKTK